ncbi:hypothetical protein K438DRAFT_1956993 [Mycena galopus ATCC 62051]|nr:hypothetical protein K438DRAFT_1956993 [Mycena galopus ATCC 62051]
MAKPEFSLQTEQEADTEEENGAADDVSTGYIDKTLETNSVKFICAASLSPTPPSSFFCLFSRLPRPSAQAICFSDALVAANMDGAEPDLASPNSSLDIPALLWDLTLVGGSEEVATLDLPAPKTNLNASARPFLSSFSEAKADNVNIDPDDKADSLEGKDVTLIEKSEKVATPGLPTSNAVLDASASPFIPSARFAVHDVVPSPLPVDTKRNFPSSPARSALSSISLNPASPEFVPKGRTINEKSGPSAAAAGMGPSRTPLNPASSEFIPKALESIVDENSAPSPIPGLAFAPIK